MPRASTRRERLLRQRRERLDNLGGRLASHALSHQNVLRRAMR